MQFLYYCLVFLSTVSVAVLFEVKKIYVIERDFKTGLLRARRQNLPVQSHTVARIGGLQDHHHHQQNMFSATAVSPPPLQSAATGGQLQQPTDLASTVDLTADSRAPIDYLTPPPNADFQFLQQSFPAGEPSTPNRPESHVQNVQAPPPPPLVPLTAPSAPVAVHTSPFTPSGGAGGGGGGFPSAQAQPPPSHGTSLIGSLAVQTSSPSNQVHSLTFANPPLEQFTPYTPSLQANDPAASHQQQQQQNGGRWELGFDASEILTPPFLGGPEQPPGGSGQTFFQQDFGQETASSVRNNKQYPASSGGSLFFGGGGGSGGGGGFDASSAANTKFTPLDAVIRPSLSNKNVYWGTPKTAQQQPLRPPPSFAEPNAFRFNNNNNNNHLHQLHHNNHGPHHHHQYVDAFQMPFTGQFDGPLSQGTVADHVVHSSFRIKRQLQDAGPPPSEAAERRGDDDRFGDRKPVYSFVKTDRNGNFKWSVRHGY